MPSAFHRHFASGWIRTGAESEPLARLAGILTFGAVIVAGAYFALLFLLVGR